MNPEYIEFLATKQPAAQSAGFEPAPFPAHMSGDFEFQASATATAIRRGRCALFLDTGLGKTTCELEFAEQCRKASNGHSLILTPLAVARQIEAEAARFGYDARVIREASDIKPGISICNYDRLDKINPQAFGAVVLDESSILKSFSGKTTRALIECFAHVPYRLAATATPAPNDHMELGQHAEFLGVMAGSEMLIRWFINDTSTASQSWRLKGHAVTPFWDWVSSWAVMAETPEDLGFDGSRYILPPMRVIRHKTGANVKPEEGMLFAADMSATSMHEVKRQTADARADMVSGIIMDDLREWIQNHKPSENGQLKRKSKKTQSTPKEEQISPIQTPPTIKASLPAGQRENLIQPPKQNSSYDTPTGSAWTTIMPCSIIKTEHAPFVAQEKLAAMESSTLTIVTPQIGSEDCSATTATLGSECSTTIPKTSEEQRTILRAEKTPAWILWCDTNEEQSILENRLGNLAISITGSMSADEKERLHAEWLNGSKPIIITKGSIFGFGVNWQHCNKMAFVGRSFSYESWYQAVRRCWRFGQTRPVDVHLIVAEGEDQIGRVIDRKAEDHGTMKAAMRAASRRATSATSAVKVPYKPDFEWELPSWLSVA